MKEARSDSALCTFFAGEVTERDKFMSPVEAKEFGIVDHVLTRELREEGKNKD